jgi:DNA-directed RNA polymerase specialized sigma54-like protein
MASNGALLTLFNTYITDTKIEIAKELMMALDSKGLLTSDIKDTITAMFDEDEDKVTLYTQEPELESTKQICVLMKNVSNRWKR